MADENKSPNASDQYEQEIEVLSLEASPYPDRRRVKVLFQLSPFSQGPNALISLVDENGKIIASVNIVNIFIPENEITLHVAEEDALTGTYQIKLDLFHIIEEEIEDEDDHVRIRQSPITSAGVSFTKP